MSGNLLPSRQDIFGLIVVVLVLFIQRNTGRAQSACQIPCQNRVCGDVGCRKECGQCPRGFGCSLGACVKAKCQGTALSVTGKLNTSVTEIGFDLVESSIIHKRDIDQWEDGCISVVEMTLRKKGTDCTLSLLAGGQLHSSDTLAIQGLTLTAGSDCPEFADAVEGTYTLVTKRSDAGLQLGLTEVPDRNAEKSCFNTVMHLKLKAQMAWTSKEGRKDNPGPLTIRPSSIRISGDFRSIGASEVFCPSPPNPIVRKLPPKRRTVKRRPRKPPKPRPALTPLKVASNRFDLLLGGGLNICASSAFYCTGLDTSIVGLLAPGIRFSKYFGAYLDFSVGKLGGGRIITRGLIPNFRFFYPFERIELFAGLGVGYSRLQGYLGYGGKESLWATPQSSIWSSLLAGKLNAGFSFDLSRSIDLGFMLDYRANYDGSGEICTGSDEAQIACSANHAGVIDLMQLYGFVKISL